MKSRTSSRTGLFLMELILAILLFALASVLCIQMFVKSHTLSKSSVELNHSILWAQNVSEIFYGCNGNGSEISSLLAGCLYEPLSEGGYRLTILFDDEFQVLPATADSLEAIDFSYRLTALVTPEDNHLLLCHLTVTKNAQAESLYELNLSLFADKEVSHES